MLQNLAPWLTGALRNKLARTEFSILFITFIISGLVWSFIGLADYAQSGVSQQFDRTILLSMRSETNTSDPLGPGWLEETARDFTALGSIPVLLWFAGATTGYLILLKKPRIALVVLITTLGAIAISSGLKEFIDRARPELVPHATVVYTASFPSGHSMHSSSVYLTLAALLVRVQGRRRLKTFILGFAIITIFVVGLSRIYLGVHWPTDVLAGWTAGTGWALLCWLLARWLQRQGQVENEYNSTRTTTSTDSLSQRPTISRPTNERNRG